MNPPIITTTAATPQDSPIATLAHGMSFSEWENNCLKPPSIVGSVKGLNNLLLPEPYPSKRKIESTSNRNTNNTCIDLEPKASVSNIKLDRKDSTEFRNDGTNQTGTKSKSTKKSSVKRRSSTKRKEKPSSANYESDMLNNERLDSLGSMDVMHKSGKRLQNNTKNTNKISPRGQQFDPNEFYNNAPKYYNNQYMEQQQPVYAHAHRGSTVYRRRLSTMDPQAFKNLANLDLKQLEMLRARALRREQELKAAEALAAKEEALVCKGFFREPIKFTTAALRKRFEVLTENRESYSLYIFPEDNKFRQACDWFVTQKWFDNVILLFIALNCITLAMERPNIPPNCAERYFLATANYVFTFVFTLEMFVKVKHISISFFLLPF